jgi:uncharacterized membrane protein YciS (DUF1049 family)
MHIEVSTVLLYLAAIITAFSTTFLRGFQNKNVAGGHKRLAFIFGYAMAICEVFTIGLAVQNGMLVAAFSGLGAGMGWVVSMKVHDKIMKKRLKEIEAAKKLKKRSKQEDRIRSIIEEILKEKGVEDHQHLVDELILNENEESNYNDKINLKKEPE